MNKKQILIAGLVILFASSTLLSITAQGKDNPWDRVWNAITEIQNRLSNIENDQDYVTHTRFYGSDEVTAGNNQEELIATFTVTPDNPSNNAILNYFFYCENRIEPIESNAKAKFAIIIYDENDELTVSMGWIDFGSFSPGEAPEYFWTRMMVPFEMDDLPIPNQSSYKFKIYLLGSGGIAYARNLTLIVETQDGLLPVS